MAKRKLHPLKAWRVKHGLSLRGAAERLGASYGYIDEIEKGAKAPSIAFARKIQKGTRNQVTVGMLANAVP